MFSPLKSKAKKLLESGLLQIEQGDTDNGIKSLESSVQLDSGNVEAWSHLALATSKANRFDIMEKAASKIVELGSKDAAIWNRLGEALLSRPFLHEDAFSVFQVSLSIEKTKDGWKGLGDALLKMGQLDEMANAYANWCVLDPDNPVAWFRRGQSLEFVKDLKKATLAYRNAVRLDSEYAPALSALALTLARQKRFSESLSVCESWQRLRPESFRLWSCKSALYVHLGRPVSAIASYQKTITLDPKAWQAYKELSELYVDLKDYDSASKTLTTILSITKGYHELWQMLGDIRGKQAKHQDALEAYEKELKIITSGEDPATCLDDKRVGDCLSNIGRTKTALGLTDEADELFVLLSKKEYKSTIHKACHAYFLEHKGLSDYTKDLEDDTMAWQLISEYFADRQNWQAAILCAETYSKLEGNSIPSQLGLARLHMQSKNYKVARNIVSNIIEEKARHSKAHFELARLYCLEGRTEEALDSLNTATKIKPSLIEMAKLNQEFHCLKDDDRFIRIANHAEGTLDNTTP